MPKCLVSSPTLSHSDNGADKENNVQENFTSNFG